MTRRLPVLFALLGLGAALVPGGCGGGDESTAATGAPASSGDEELGGAAPEGPAANASDDVALTDVLEGRASYYADSLAGNSTASGEPYDPQAYTAASRDLPFGTRVRVTRLDGEGQPMASVIVRVNDRGPHRDHSRILDLSRAAAEALDMIRAGVVDIRAEILAE